MSSCYEQMEACFTCSSDELKRLAVDPEWRVRFAAAVAIGERQDADYIDALEEMLAIEDARPLFTQPVTEFVGVDGDTSLAEQVKPFQVVFPVPADEATQEAWKTRGRVKQAVLFAIYSIGEANERLIDKLHGYIQDANQDATVKAAAVRALGKVGGPSSLPYCKEAAAYDEWCTRVEAVKAMGVLSNG
ncbi:HEAT repeat domain-containing protein [Paenibacillus montanisoli]|uniref:HEAT repeat domain-containing protein n=1 Tax=Paenibacillus montanisoli TaxID=2081970 RepID=A0A328U3W1_9BACL|nr:HEAT repeat domain-containing protein [Paenibacillus montanisoli]RAP74596.1 hypothetical protein DL346_21285 [Paenibacillus montanisoli]